MDRTFSWEKVRKVKLQKLRAPGGSEPETVSVSLFFFFSFYYYLQSVRGEAGDAVRAWVADWIAGSQACRLAGRQGCRDAGAKQGRIGKIRFIEC